MKNKILIIICSIILVLSICGTVVGYLNKDKIVSTQQESKTEVYPDFKDYEVSQILEFANKNNIKLSIEYITDDEYPKGTVLFQSKSTSEIIRSGDSLTVYVSDGSKNNIPEMVPFEVDTEENIDEDSEEDTSEEDEKMNQIKKELNLNVDVNLSIFQDKYYLLWAPYDVYKSGYVEYDDSYHEHNNYEGYKEEDEDKSITQVIDIKTKKALLTEKGELGEHTPTFTSENGFILLEQVCTSECSNYYSRLYTSNLKELARDFDSLTFNDNKALVLNKNIITKYDNQGNTITDDVYKASSDEKILNIFLDYVLVNENNSIYIKRGDEKYLIDTLNSNKKYSNSDYSSEDKSIFISIQDKSLTVKDYLKYNPDEDIDNIDSNYLFSYYKFDINTKKIEKTIESFM